jgi:hypothetical protein
MKTSMLIPALALGMTCLALGSCNEDDGDADTETLRAEGALGKDNPPELGDRVDRAGRPAITAALISTFNPEGQATVRDAYNRSGQLNRDFLETMEQSLGVLDGLDGNCGNQLLANMAAEGQPRYRPLAEVLLDDQVYVHSDRVGAPSVYLGLEAELVLGGNVSGGGGGRAPGDDVIARSYSVLAAGVLSGVDDGVSRDDETHDQDVFPFLAEPQ